MRKRITRIVRRWMPPVLFEWVVNRYADYLSLRFKSLLKRNSRWKSIHQGERVFILGSGPSIKRHDLQKLTDENLIFLNNFFVHPLFPTISLGKGKKYFLTAPIHPPQSREEWATWLMQMSERIPEQVVLIFGHSKKRDTILSLLQENGIFEKHEKLWYFPGRFYSSDTTNTAIRYLDPTECILTSYSASIYALIWALYMGFSEIYLIGMDHDRIFHRDPTEGRFYNGAAHQENEEARTAQLAGKTPNSLYIEATAEIFQQYALIERMKRSNIVNLSSTSILDIFPYYNFDQLPAGEHR